MFEEAAPKNSLKVIGKISSKIADFYLAGGTGLALQLGHRRSRDFDFFSPRLFNVHILVKRLCPDRIIQVSEGTVHTVINRIRFSFLYFEAPLIHRAVIWRGIRIADWRDIVAEKFRAISDRGTKKDFYDLYAVLQDRLSIRDACGVFKTRFGKSGVNAYHVLKSLAYFDDAEEEPSPILLQSAAGWRWERIKKFFTLNIREFERYLLENV